MKEKVISFSPVVKLSIVLIFDIAVILLSTELAYIVRFGIERFIFEKMQSSIAFSLLALSVSLPVYAMFGLYHAVLRYMGPQVSFIIVRASIFSIIGIVVAITLLPLGSFPRSIPVLYGLISGFLLGLSRYAMRYWLVGNSLVDVFFSVSGREQGIPVAIYGAGEAGAQLVEALNQCREYRPVAFIDDDQNMIGRFLLGKKIYSSEQIAKMMVQTGTREFLLAIPSAGINRRKEIMLQLETFGLPIKTMPGLKELASGRLKLQEIQNVDVGDVLGREEVKPVPELLRKDITGKIVLVTGAGGSIGSEISRQAIVNKPNVLILFDHSEFNLYVIEKELNKTINNFNLNIKVVSVLGSVVDPVRVLDVIRTYQVDTIYHAAAYKHVPIVQYNISQGLINNVMGTLYTAQAAIIGGVKRFVLISTDKAVRPANVMGASKRLAELVLQALSNEREVTLYDPQCVYGGATVKNNTCFSMVRFGNVLGSSGSVIPLFREQISAGGPVTVTHPDINRYFMTIPEAAQLVIQAGSMGEGGDVFVLDMGQPVKIVELAKKMISLSGLKVKDANNPYGDIEIVFTGLRPGEKLYEELLLGDNVSSTPHSRIFKAWEEMLEWNEVVELLNQIMRSLEQHQYITIYNLLLKYVHGYQTDSNVVDWLYQLSNESFCPFKKDCSTVNFISNNFPNKLYHKSVFVRSVRLICLDSYICKISEVK